MPGTSPKSGIIGMHSRGDIGLARLGSACCVTRQKAEEGSEKLAFLSWTYSYIVSLGHMHSECRLFSKFNSPWNSYLFWREPQRTGCSEEEEFHSHRPLNVNVWDGKVFHQNWRLDKCQQTMAHEPNLASCPLLPVNKGLLDQVTLIHFCV